MTDDPSSLRQRAIGWARQLRSIAIALGLVLAVRTVVAEPYHVPSPSMVPTLLVGDELIASKFVYGWGKYSSPIGLLPAEGALPLVGLDIPAEDFAELLRVTPEEWKAELPSLREHLAIFGDKLPAEMTAQLDALESRLNAAS